VSPELLEMIEQDAASVQDIDPADAMWTGSPGQRLDLDKALDGDLGELTALEQILLAIIDAYPNVPVPVRSRKSKVKSPRQIRLEQVLKLLIGWAPPKGRIKKGYEADLERVAWRYFAAALGNSASGTMLREIMVDEVVSEEDRAGLDHKQIDNLIRGHLREFERNKDRLLVKVSARGLPEVEERARNIALVIRAFRQLGIICTPKS
jgi:hypothetical protein